eukprot:1563160-Prymnesium_polylepis.1
MTHRICRLSAHHCWGGRSVVGVDHRLDRELRLLSEPVLLDRLARLLKVLRPLGARALHHGRHERELEPFVERSLERTLTPASGHAQS